MTVIEIQRNKFDENDIRNKFENLGSADEVAIVLLNNENSEERNVTRGSQDGVYDITSLGEDDSLIITDLTEYFTNSSDSIDERKFQNSKFVIKCNICNYSFLSFTQLNEHNEGDHHNEKLLILKSREQDDGKKTDDALINLLRELLDTHRDKIKCININNKVLIDLTAEDINHFEANLLKLIVGF